MKRNLRFVVILVALGVILGGVIGVSAQRILGGYSPVATDNPEVVAAADFAVDEQGKEAGDDLQAGFNRARRTPVSVGKQLPDVPKGRISQGR
jgi:hypothetical protein